jgi:hypothetical protein
MGQHSSARAGSGHRRAWRRVAIAGVVAGVGYATIGLVGLASGTTTSTPSVYSSITPVTVLGKSLAAHSNTDVPIAGVGSVPSNATSVQLSITALNGTTTSSMYVYPSGATQPTSANVRWTTGEVVTIPVTVGVSAGNGDIRLTTDGGTVTVKVQVVGYFSPAPVTTGYAATTEEDVQIQDTGADATTVASVDVPAGTYELQAKATMILTGGTTELVNCDLQDPAATTMDSSSTIVNSGLHDAATSLEGLDTTSGGTFTFSCSDDFADAEAYDAQLVAVQLGAANGQVTGG